MAGRSRTLTVLVTAILLLGSVTAPIAVADDPLAPIRGAVNGERAKTRCPALKYSSVLENAAQAWARNQGVVTYLGKKTILIGQGDPAAAATNKALDQARSTIGDCAYTEFGVGFNRWADTELDWVTIALGTPAPEAPRPNAPATEAPGSVPSPTPTPPKVAPTDAIRVSFDKGIQWTVNVTSTADIPGACTYAATNPLLPGSNRTFDITPNGTASFVVLAPPPFSTYHVVVSCSGPFDGGTVEFGHVEKDVSA
jgi:hypothetical protein